MSMHSRQEPDKSAQKSGEKAITPERAKGTKSAHGATHAQTIPVWARGWRDGIAPGLMIQTKLGVSQPGDVYEQEADRAAEQVMGMASSENPISGGRNETQVRLSKQSRETGANSTAQSPDVPPGVYDALNSGGGQPLDAGTRTFMEPRLGYDFGGVRVHTNAQAADSARAMSALAYTVGSDLVFGSGHYQPETHEGQRLLAHELTHVVQQSGLGARVQRYESGEHAQFGETGDVLEEFIAERALKYKVKPGDTLKKIAAKYGIPVEDLKEANSGKLKKWHTTGGGGKKDSTVEGFNAGEEITIPAIINEFTREALKSKELTFTIKGVTLEYGEGISMGDFYLDPMQMISAPEKELLALSALIKKEKSGTPVTNKEWDDATGGRYSDLAEKNEAHFAPPNARLVDISSAAHGWNHKTEWERYHRMALDKSHSGAKNDALQFNAFADHFLTDAFAAGHLINKRDVMEKFRGGLTVDKKGDFIGHAQDFFDNVAKESFVGDAKKEFSQYETVERHYGFHPNIDSVDRFSSLLQGIQKEEPEALLSVVAKAVHDALNKLPSGLSVENAMGDKWQLSGDGTLNAKSKEIGRKAVAQSQLNVFDAYNLIGPLDYGSYYKKVWDYVPIPTASGEAEIKAQVASGTDLTNKVLISAIATLIKQEYALILKGLVDRKILRKA
jgi:LysM repeat protein